MFITHRLIGSSLIVLCVVTVLVAQDQTRMVGEQRTAPIVTASAATDRVRFTAPGSTVQMQLEVFTYAGEKVFATSQSGNVLDWTIQENTGQRLADGSYFCVVGMKSLSGKVSQKLGTLIVQEKQLAMQPVDAAQLTPALSQFLTANQLAETSSPLEGVTALTIVSEGEPDAITTLAHDGTKGVIDRSRGALSFRMGDFFTGNDKEQMRLTEEGNLGIGTDSPHAKLDVAGVIRTSKGIEFDNGTNVTRLTTTAAGNLQQTLADGTVVPNVTGTGTQNQVAKWTDNAGTLSDSTITETGGKVGIGVNNPSYRLVVGPDIGPGLTTSDLTISRGPGQSVSIFAGATGAHGMNFGWDEANQRAFVNAPVQSPITFTHGGVNERMRIETNGNVGIGVTIPTAKLDVAGNFNISGNGTAGGNLSANFVDAATGYRLGGGRFLGVSGDGNSNLFVGYNVANNISAGSSNNAFFGHTAGFSTGAGSNNSFFGTAAGLESTGDNNSFFGKGAGSGLATGSNNTFAGRDAGLNNTSGGYDSFLGAFAGVNNDSGSGNTFLGGFAGQSNSLGFNNTYLGYQTGSASAGGGNLDTAIGYNAQVTATTNGTAIGANAVVQQDNSLVLGSIAGVNGAFASTKVGIGTTFPNFRLDVADRMRVKQGPGGTAGIWFFQSTPNANQAFVGMLDDTRVGFFGNSGGGWSLFTDTTTGIVTVNNLGDAGATPLCRNNVNAIATCSSSLRYKKDVAHFAGGLDIVNRLRPITFTWKDHPERDLGFGAEDVAAVEPLLVTHNAKGEIEGVKYDRLSAVLINAVQQQQRQIKSLEARNTAAQTENTALKTRLDRLEEVLGELQLTAKQQHPRKRRSKERQNDSAALPLRVSTRSD